MAGSRSAAAMCSMGAVSTRSGASDGLRGGSRSWKFGRRVHGRVDHGAKPYPVASSRVVTAVLRAQRR